MSKKIPKDVLGSLQRIAETMPKRFYEYNSNVVLTGKEMLKNNIQTKHQVKEKNLYARKLTHLREISHFTRLKKIYKSLGNEGILEYVKKQIELNTEMQQLDLSTLIQVPKL